MISTYQHHSPSALNQFAASPALFVLERILGLKQVVGAPAHRGVAVEAGVALGLVNPKASEKECYEAAYTAYDTVSALSPDERKEKYRENIPDMVTQALDELRPYGKPTDVQGFIEWKAPNLQLPIVGYFDFCWLDKGIVVDLKTTERMPSEIKVPHARQVSLYAGDNHEGRLTYVTPKKCQTYQLENIREHRQALIELAIIVENFLALSNDPEFFVDITAPDLESFYWTAPHMRQLAFQYWGI
jgi:hypothetical protein